MGEMLCIYGAPAHPHSPGGGAATDSRLQKHRMLKYLANRKLFKATQVDESVITVPRHPAVPEQQSPHPGPHHRSVTLYGFLNHNLCACKLVILLSVAGIICRNKFLEAPKGRLYAVKICGAEN